jgi:hypothetical protein
LFGLCEGSLRNEWVALSGKSKGLPARGIIFEIGDTQTAFKIEKAVIEQKSRTIGAENRNAVRHFARRRWSKSEDGRTKVLTITLEIHGCVFCTDALENESIFLAAQTAQSIPAEDINFVNCS